MSVISIPRKIYINAIASEGETELNAFDNCLVKSGLPQVSLIKVTSILPRDIIVINDPPNLPLGCNVPTIYAVYSSCEKGKLLAGALAIGWTDGPTLVAEFASEGMSKEKAEKEALFRLEKMAEARGLRIIKKIVVSVDHVVEKCGCVLVFAAEVE